MKKVICAAAAVLMVASLTACSGQSGESAAAGEGNTHFLKLKKLVLYVLVFV